MKHFEKIKTKRIKGNIMNFEMEEKKNWKTHPVKQPDTQNNKDCSYGIVLVVTESNFILRSHSLLKWFRNTFTYI